MAREYRSRKYTPVPCVQCKKEIVAATSGSQKFCTTRCREKFYEGKDWQRNDPSYLRNDKLVRQYGITLAKYNEMFAEQNGGCAICGKREKHINWRSGRPQNLAVDHDHKTNEVRGLLCQKCNQAIGLFGDSIENLNRAIDYLKG